MLESGEPVGVFRKLLRQRLDGDVAVERRVACLPDFSHPAPADGEKNLVAAKPRAGLHQRPFARRAATRAGVLRSGWPAAWETDVIVAMVQVLRPVLAASDRGPHPPPTADMLLPWAQIPTFVWSRHGCRWRA